MNDEAGLVVLSIRSGAERNASLVAPARYETRQRRRRHRLSAWVAERSETTLHPGVRLIWTGEVMQAD